MSCPTTGPPTTGGVLEGAAGAAARFGAVRCKARTPTKAGTAARADCRAAAARGSAVNLLRASRGMFEEGEK